MTPPRPQHQKCLLFLLLFLLPLPILTTEDNNNSSRWGPSPPSPTSSSSESSETLPETLPENSPIYNIPAPSNGLFNPDYFLLPEDEVPSSDQIDRQDGFNSELCTQRSCDQIVSGRDLSYERALEIVQGESYLDQADLGIIRKRRKKRTIPITTGLDFATIVNPAILLPAALFGALFVMGRSLSSGETSSPQYQAQQPAASYGSAEQQYQQPEAPQYQPEPPQYEPVASQANPYIKHPSGPIVRPLEGFAPPTSPQPGEFGGGAPAIPNTAVGIEGVGLVPASLKGVSVLPPYAVQRRQLAATCVIFSENDARSILHFTQLNPNVCAEKPAYNGRRKRRGVLDVVRRTNRGFMRVMDKLLQKRPRDERRRRQQLHRASGYNAPAPSYAREQQSFDCLDGRVIPRIYGFRCRIQLVRQRCVLGDTCDIFGNKCQSGQEQSCPKESNNQKQEYGFSHRQGVPDVLLSRQTGQEFSSDAPADCRTEFIGCS